MTEKKPIIPLMIAFSTLLLFAATCQCTSSTFNFDFPGTEPRTLATSSKVVNITGYPVDEYDFLVPGEFVVNIKSLSSGLTISQRFTDFEFKISIQTPSFAGDNDTLLINITSLSGDVIYGNATLKLVNLESSTDYSVRILILNPPPNYSMLYIALFIVIMGALLGAYAYFTRWMIGRMVVKRVNEVRLKEWKKQGGNMNP